MANDVGILCFKNFHAAQRPATLNFCGPFQNIFHLTGARSRLCHKINTKEIYP